MILSRIPLKIFLVDEIKIFYFLFLLLVTVSSQSLAISLEIYGTKKTMTLLNCTGDQVLVEYFPLYVDGYYCDCLIQSKQFYDFNGVVEFYRNGYGLSELPEPVGDRFSSVLSQGWEVIPAYENLMAEGNDVVRIPSLHMMLYIAFGTNDFNKYPSTINGLVEGGIGFDLKRNILEGVEVLNIGDVVVICHATDFLGLQIKKQDSVMYLGNRAFLYWDACWCFFYIMDNEALHKFAGDNYRVYNLKDPASTTTTVSSDSGNVGRTKKRAAPRSLSVEQSISKKAENESSTINEDLTPATSNISETISFINNNGERLTLKDKCDQEGVKCLSNFECCVCLDVYEKPLRTRACEHYLCLSCYTDIPDKKCPVCRMQFEYEEVNKDLKKADRFVLSTIEETYPKLEVVTKASDDETKRQAGKHTNIYEEDFTPRSTMYTSSQSNIQRRRQGRRSYPYSRPSISCWRNVTTPDFQMASGSNIISIDSVTGSGRVTFRGGSTTDITISAQEEVPVEEYLCAFSQFDCLSVVSVSGSITLILHTNEEEQQDEFIKINTAEGSTQIRNRTVETNTEYTSIEVYLPLGFNKPVILKTDSGSITTRSGFKLQSQGEIKSVTGSIRLNIDSNQVSACASTVSGLILNEITNRTVFNASLLVYVSTVSGSIRIIDEY